MFNHSKETLYFLNLINSNPSLGIYWISFVGVLLGYLYLLFYLEKWGIYTFIDQSKGAQEGALVFMAYRLTYYILALIIIYLLFVNYDIFGSFIMLIILAIPFVLKPLMTDFKNIVLDYKTLETLKSEPLTGIIGNLIKQKPSNGILITILRSISPHTNNSLAVLPFIVIFVALPAGVNPIVIAYAVLTIIFLFWINSVVFGNIPQDKVNVFLKNGKIYENMYKIAVSPQSDFEYLNNSNEVIHIQGSDIEKELFSRHL